MARYKVSSGVAPTGVSWSLALGSCFDRRGLPALDDESVDHTISDAPYEAEAHEKQRQNGGKKKNGGYHEEPDDSHLYFPPITEEERYEVARQWCRISRHWIIVFCQVEAVHLWKKAIEDRGGVYRRCIPWIKPAAKPSFHGRWPGQAFEAIVLAQARKRGVRKCSGNGRATWFNDPRDPPLQVLDKDGYPLKNAAGKLVRVTAKPVLLMDGLIELVSQPGETILDNYAGTGTTGVAAMRARRSFIGMEQNEHVHRLACRRLGAEELRPVPGQALLF